MAGMKRLLLVLLLGLALLAGILPEAGYARGPGLMPHAQTHPEPPVVRDPAVTDDLPDAERTVKDNAPGLPEQRYLYGVVLEVEELGQAPGSELFKPIQAREQLQRVKVRLTSDPLIKGLRKGSVVTVENIIGDNPAYNIILQPGARVLLNAEQSPQGKWVFYVANRDRVPALIVLGTVLALAVVLLGGAEVLKHVLLAVLLLIGTYQILFPAVLGGGYPALWTLGFCLTFIVLGSFVYQSPSTPAFSREQLVVIFGAIGGMLLMMILIWMMHVITPLDGFSDEALASLWYLSPRVDYWGLFLSTALLAFQGFIFYLAWMMAQNRKETLSFGKRFSILMIRGRRLVGPMISSLGLLFLGLFAPLLLQMQGMPTAQFANLEKTASIITIAFAGGLTLVLMVPLTAVIAAILLSERETPAVHPPSDTTRQGG